jgi:ABC-type lipoprotein export system ATPase subunit
MLGALDRPTSGRVFINGRDMETVKDLDVFRAKTVGFVFQLHNLIPTLTARENVEVPMMSQDLGRRRRHERSQELLELVGLGERMDHLPNQLSGGQRQRVAIARSLANEPALVLADEPTGNLDSESGGEVVDLMRRLNRDLGTTFVIVTHDHTIARETDRVLVMQDGRIVDDRNVDDPFEEDLKAFRDSGLGQALLDGETPALEWLDEESRRKLRQVLENEMSGANRR